MADERALSLELDIQFALPVSDRLPDQASIEHWVDTVLRMEQRGGETHMTIRIVTEQEGAELNEAYRGKNGPTNVLSFPYEGVGEVIVPLLGDIVICEPVVMREAGQQGKEHEAHWCHMVVHGVLHLLGYDHLKEEEAIDMENREIKILESIGFSNPYKLGV